jgi:uncharacterized membrane protein
MLRRAFGIAAITWAVTLPLATWIASGTHRPWPFSAFALVVYRAASELCHQAPARSFQLWAMQMPVCARCTGIYLGGAVAALAAVAGERRVLPAAGRTALIVAAVPSLATLVFEWTTGQMPAGWVRALAGVPLGAVVAWVIVRGEAVR